MAFTVPGEVFEGRRGVSVPDTRLGTTQTRALPTNRVAANTTDLRDVIAGLDEASRTAQQFSEMEADAAAKEADSRAADEIRRIMRDPENGYLFTRGSASIERRDTTLEELDAVMGRSTEGMNGMAARAASSSIEARLTSARNSLDTHAGDQRLAWIDAASLGRTETAADDAVAGFDNDGEIGVALAIGAAEIRDRAERNGWSDDQLRAAQDNWRSKTLQAVAMRRGELDPIGALEWAEDMGVDGPELAAIEAKLGPEARRREGMALGDAAYTAGGDGTGGGFDKGAYLGTVVGVESGGDATAEATTSSAGGLGQFIDSTWLATIMKHAPTVALQHTEEELLAMKTDDSPEGVRFQTEMLSAFTDDNIATLARAGLPVNNTNLYMSHFFGPTGARKVIKADPTTSIATLFPKDTRGSDGPGKGGPNGVPDIIDANPFLSGMSAQDAQRWAAGKAEGAGGAPDPMRQVLQIENPDVQAAAIQRVARLQTIETREIARQRAEAEQIGFSHVEQGGAVDDLPLEVRERIGLSGVNGLREYERKRTASGDIVTDDQVLYNLRLQSAQDPEAFAEANLMQFRGKLSNAHFQEIQRIQTAVINADNKATSKAPKVLSFGGVKSTIQANAPGVFKFNSKDDADAARIYNAVTSDVVEFHEEHGRNPDPQEMNEIVQRQLAQVYTDGTGFFGLFDASEKPFFQAVQLLEESMAAGESVDLFSTDPMTITPSLYRDIVAKLVADGIQDPDAEDVMQVILDARELRGG